MSNKINKARIHMILYDIYYNMEPDYWGGGQAPPAGSLGGRGGGGGGGGGVKVGLSKRYNVFGNGLGCWLPLAGLFEFYLSQDSSYVYYILTFEYCNWV